MLVFGCIFSSIPLLWWVGKSLKTRQEKKVDGSMCGVSVGRCSAVGAALDLVDLLVAYVNLLGFVL